MTCANDCPCFSDYLGELTNCVTCVVLKRVLCVFVLNVFAIIKNDSQFHKKQCPSVSICTLWASQAQTTVRVKMDCGANKS